MRPVRLLAEPTPTRIPEPSFSNSEFAWTCRASRPQPPRFFVIIENHAGRGFLRLNNPGIVQRQVECVSFLASFCVAHRMSTSSRSKIRFKRLIFLEATNTHHAEANNTTLRVDTLHKRVVFCFLHVAGCIRKPHFEIVGFCVEPRFCFIGHKASPAFGLSVR